MRVRVSPALLTNFKKVNMKKSNTTKEIQDQIADLQKKIQKLSEKKKKLKEESAPKFSKTDIKKFQKLCIGKEFYIPIKFTVDNEVVESYNVPVYIKWEEDDSCTFFVEESNAMLSFEEDIRNLPKIDQYIEKLNSDIVKFIDHFNEKYGDKWFDFFIETYSP